MKLGAEAVIRSLKADSAYRRSRSSRRRDDSSEAGQHERGVACGTLRWNPYIFGKMALMKSATRLTSKGQVLIPKLVREQLRWASGTQLAVEIMGDGAVRLTPFEAEGPIDTLYGCLRDLPRDPLADLEAEHQAEIEADERGHRRGR